MVVYTVMRLTCPPCWGRNMRERVCVTEGGRDLRAFLRSNGPLGSSGEELSCVRV